MTEGILRCKAELIEAYGFACLVLLPRKPRCREQEVCQGILCIEVFFFKGVEGSPGDKDRKALG